MGELRITLDCPFSIMTTCPAIMPWRKKSTRITEFVVSTPLRLYHLEHMNDPNEPNAQIRICRALDVMAGWPDGTACLLSVGDYVRILEALTPLLAPLDHLNLFIEQLRQRG